MPDMSVATKVKAEDLKVNDLIERSPGRLVTIMDIRKPTKGPFNGLVVIKYPLVGYDTYPPDEEILVFNR